MNPLAKLWVFLVIVISAISVTTWMPILFITGLCVAILFIYKAPLYVKVKSFLLLLPTMFFLYTIISAIILRNPLEVVLQQAGFISIKFFCMIIMMGLYLEFGDGAKLIPALRTLWMRLNKPWKSMEYAFLFSALVLRFFPAFQMEWETMKHSNKALGIPEDKSLILRVKQLIQYLPGMILSHYQQAESVAQQMIGRGFGKSFPRTVANPIDWKMWDTMLVITTPIFIIWIYQIAAL